MFTKLKVLLSPLYHQAGRSLSSVRFVFVVGLVLLSFGLVELLAGASILDDVPRSALLVVAAICFGALLIVQALGNERGWIDTESLKLIVMMLTTLFVIAAIVQDRPTDPDPISAEPVPVSPD